MEEIKVIKNNAEKLPNFKGSKELEKSSERIRIYMILKLIFLKVSISYN